MRISDWSSDVCSSDLELIEKTIRAEEDSFAITLDKGMKLLEEAIARLSDKTIPGDVVFKLYDTYGFPFDLTADIASERELTLDEIGRASCRERVCQYG